MSIYSNVTEQDLNNLCQFSEQQKNQRVPKSKNRILKQTHDNKLAESLSPITKNLDQVNETTKKRREFIKESNSANETPQLAIENNQNDISLLMKERLSSLTRASNSLRLKQDDLGIMSILGTLLQTGGKKFKINDDVFELSPELHKTLSSTSYTGKTMR